VERVGSAQVRSLNEALEAISDLGVTLQDLRNETLAQRFSLLKILDLIRGEPSSDPPD
jgi:hypothetical protein